jgi:hypothetical protein
MDRNALIMTGSIEPLFLVVVVFVSSHFVLGLPQGQAVLVDKFGENGTRPCFPPSALAGLSGFSWPLATHHTSRFDLRPIGPSGFPMSHHSYRPF